MSLTPRFRSYWANYGGTKAVFSSPYFWAACSLTLITYRWWSSHNWWERVLAIEPSLLGFSLGGYVLLLAVGSERFMELLARAGPEDDSALIGVSAAFVHFIAVQFSALLLAIVFVATEEAFWSSVNFSSMPCMRTLRTSQAGLSILAFFYSFTTGIAATLRIFSLTNLYAAMARHAQSTMERGASKDNPLYVTIVPKRDKPTAPQADVSRPSS